MLQNAYFLAKIGADTAENEQHFAEICQKLATTRRVVARHSSSRSWSVAQTSKMTSARPRRVDAVGCFELPAHADVTNMHVSTKTGVR